MSELLDGSRKFVHKKPGENEMKRDFCHTQVSSCL